MPTSSPLRNALDRLIDWIPPLSFTRAGYVLRRDVLHDDADAPMRDMTGKVVAITGANSGLGAATAEALAGMGATVCMLCRSVDRAERARDAIAQATGSDALHVLQVDTSSSASRAACVETFLDRFDRLDVLINNAGVLLDRRAESVDGVEMTFATNVLGYFDLTQRFLPTLRATPSARVVSVSSGGMYLVPLNLRDPEFERRPFDGVQAYAESKRAEIILARLFARDPDNQGVAFHTVHPGWADTPGVSSSLPRFHVLTRAILRTPEQGADGIIWLAAAPDDALAPYPEGAFWFDRLPRSVDRLPYTRASRDDEEALWALCERALDDSDA